MSNNRPTNQQPATNEETPMTLTEKVTEHLTQTRSQRHPETAEARFPHGSIARRLDGAAVAGYLGHLGTVTNLHKTFDGNDGFNEYRFWTFGWTHVVFADGTVATNSTGIDCGELEQYGCCRTPKQHGNGLLHLHNSEMDTDDTVYATRRSNNTFLVRRDGKTYIVRADRAIAYLDTRENNTPAPTECKSCRGRGTHTEGNADGSQRCTVTCRQCNGTGTRS